MKADFLVKKESFYIEDKNEFISGIRGIVELGVELRELEDCHHIHDSFYSFSTPHGIMQDISWGNNNNEILDRDLKSSFRIFLDKSKNITENCENLEIFSILVDNEHIGFMGGSFLNCSEDEKREVANKKQLLEFHRNYLKVVPPERDVFRDVIHKYSSPIFIFIMILPVDSTDFITPMRRYLAPLLSI